MEPTSADRHLTFFVALLAAMVAALAPAHAQSSEDGARQARLLEQNVIAIEATWQDGSVEEGFGFVVGEEGEEVYVATANHVLRGDDPGQVASRITLRLQQRPGRTFQGRLLDLRHEDLDLGVVVASLPPAIPWVWAALAPRPDEVRFGTPVWFVGRDGQWYVPARPGRVNLVDPISREMLVDDLSVRVGSSGAALISRDGIVGMVVRDDDPAVALTITAIEDQIERWRLPWSLKDADTPGAMVFIEGGRFTWGMTERDLEQVKRELAGRWDASAVLPSLDRMAPPTSITLSPFQIDKYEVTWGRYREFAAGENTLARLPEWLARYHPGDEYPAVGVTWAEADAFCQSNGKRLPSEAEWERAARGAEGRLFPWGDKLPDSLDVVFCRSCSTESLEQQRPMPIGSSKTDRSSEGIRDLAGSVREWVRDWYASDFYVRASARNPHNMTETEYRSVRGGSWYHSPEFLLSAMRSGNEPTRRDPTIGFRCAASTSASLD